MSENGEVTGTNTEIKPGWKTSEFYVTISTSLIGILIAFNVVDTESGTQMMNLLEKIIGGLMALISVSSYTFSRAKVKSSTKK